MIDPEFWLDEELAKISPRARLLYIGLWNLCDDHYATLPNRPEWIKIQVFPYESVNTPQLLQELSTNGKILPFSFDGQDFWYIKNFFKYQHVEKPSKAKYPEYRGVVGEESVTTPAKVKLSKVSKVKLSKEKSSGEDAGGGMNLIRKRIKDLKLKHDHTGK